MPNDSRPLPLNFTPWREYLESHASPTEVEYNDSGSEKIMELKKEVKKMMIDNLAQVRSLSEKLNVIDAVQRLGLSCYFQNQIEAILATLHLHHNNNLHDCEDHEMGCHDLCTVALLFRLLRQQGYDISSDVFNKFKDGEGGFNESIANDIQGMLSFYQAAHLRVHDENILDEALIFTTTHLKSALSNLSSPLLDQVNRALKNPIRKSMSRQEARHFMSTYELDESHNEVLLKLAKLDFNQLQKLYKKELSELIRWRKDIDCGTNLLSFSRDRLLECYFWSLGAFTEAKYSLSRIMFAKQIVILTIVDDMYDSFGTLEELELFSETLERWNICAIDKLPEYMKLAYKAIMDFFGEVEEKLAMGRSYCIGYCKEAFLRLVRAYLQESTWLHKKHMPTLEEYLLIGYESAGSIVMIAIAFTGMGDIVTEDSLAWVLSEPKIVRAMSVIGRIMNDIGHHKSKQRKSGHIVASAVECYMKQYGTAEEEAVSELTKWVLEVWKDVNEECTRSTIPRPLVMQVLELVRTNDEIYRDGDCFTEDVLLKDKVASSIIDPVPV